VRGRGEGGRGVKEATALRVEAISRRKEGSVVLCVVV